MNSHRLPVLVSVVLVVVSLFTSAAAPAAIGANSDVPLADGNPCTKQGSFGFQASFVTPYWFFNRSESQIDTLFHNQQAVGSNQIILQWSSHISVDADTGTVTQTAAYPGSIRYSHFNDAVPQTIKAAKARGMKVWVGLAAAPGLLDTDTHIYNADLLRQLKDHTLWTAAELYKKYGYGIDGWYLPIEPNEFSVFDASAQTLQVAWIKNIVAALHTAYPGVPVMGSPSMPRATFKNKSAKEFIQGFAPFLTNTGVDVWNIQDGFKMTAWSVAEEVAAFEAAKKIAGPSTEIWASVYTPGPGEPNSPIDSEDLQNYLLGLGQIGIPLTDFTFSEHMNPDASVDGGGDRAASHQDYRHYCFAEASPASSKGSRNRGVTHQRGPRM